MKVEFGNIAQIVSAATSAVVAGIAVYALFFSPASQMVLSYLHSELAQRNSKIVALEAHEQELQTSIKSRESDLRSLETSSARLKAEMASLVEQRDQLKNQVSMLESDQKELSARMDQVRSNLSQTEFALIREKMGVTLASQINILLPLKIGDEIRSAKGSRPRKEEFWTGYLEQARSSIKKLPADQQAVGEEVVRNFNQQCQKLASVRLDIPALKYPSHDDPEAIRKRQDVDQKEKTLTDRFFAAEKDLENCFHSVARQ